MEAIQNWQEWQHDRIQNEKLERQAQGLQNLAEAKDKQREARAAERAQLYAMVKETGMGLSKALGVKAEALAKVLGFWLGKVPFQEREDVLQGMALALLEYRPCTPGLAFAVCRGYVGHWWDAYKVRSHQSLDIPIENAEGDDYTLADTLVAETEWELRLDGQTLYDKLPNWVRVIVARKLTGQKLGGGDNMMLRRFATANAGMLMST